MAPPNKKSIQLIHIAKGQLQISEDDYRGILAHRYNGKSSSLDLSQRQADDLIHHFKSLGFKVRRKKAKNQYRTPMQRKVAAMWSTLGKAGALKKPGDKSLQSYVKRMVKRDHLRWCGKEECGMLIEALKAWAKRENVDVR